MNPIYHKRIVASMARLGRVVVRCETRPSLGVFDTCYSTAWLTEWLTCPRGWLFADPGPESEPC